jgi:hypothetical protein
VNFFQWWLFAGGNIPKGTIGTRMKVRRNNGEHSDIRRNQKLNKYLNVEVVRGQPG